MRRRTIRRSTGIITEYSYTVWAIDNNTWRHLRPIGTYATEEEAGTNGSHYWWDTGNNYRVCENRTHIRVRAATTVAQWESGRPLPDRFDFQGMFMAALAEQRRNAERRAV